jgi:hypothetical protein
MERWSEPFSALAAHGDSECAIDVTAIVALVEIVAETLVSGMSRSALAVLGARNVLLMSQPLARPCRDYGRNPCPACPEVRSPSGRAPGAALALVWWDNLRALHQICRRQRRQCRRQCCRRERGPAWPARCARSGSTWRADGPRILFDRFHLVVMAARAPCGSSLKACCNCTLRPSTAP